MMGGKIKRALLVRPLAIGSTAPLEVIHDGEWTESGDIRFTLPSDPASLIRTVMRHQVSYVEEERIPEAPPKRQQKPQPVEGTGPERRSKKARRRAQTADGEAQASRLEARSLPEAIRVRDIAE